MRKLVGITTAIFLFIFLTACGNAQTANSEVALFEGIRPGQSVPEVVNRFDNNESYTIEKREINYEWKQTTSHMVVIGKTNNEVFSIFGNDVPFINFTYDPLKEQVKEVNSSLQVSDLYGAELTNVLHSLLDEISKTATLTKTDKQETNESYYYTITLDEKPYTLRVSAWWGDKENDYSVSMILITLLEAE